MLVLPIGPPGRLVDALEVVCAGRGDRLLRLDAPELPPTERGSPEDVLVICGAGIRDLGITEERARTLRRTGEWSLRLAGELAAEGRNVRLLLLSTAYLETRGPSGPSPFQRACGSLERTFEETDLPRTIVRPSLTVRPAPSLPGSGSRMIPAVRVLGRGILPWLPGREETIVDLLPADVAARAVLALADLGGGPHLLAAGPGRSARLGQVVEAAAEHLDVRAPRLVDPGGWLRRAGPILRLALGRRGRALIERGEAYLGCLERRTPFRPGSEVRARLEDAGLAPPPVEEYVREVLDVLG